MLQKMFRLLVLAWTAAFPVLAQPQPFTAQDLWRAKRISDPQVSPDGRQVVFVVREYDLESGRGRSNLWLLKLEGGAAHRLTTHSGSDFNPRWDPQGGKIWFLSNRSGSTQIWSIPVAGGEATQVSRLPLDVSNLALSPDGRHLVFSLEVFPDCETPECSAERLGKEQARKASGRLYERLFVRHWDHWKEGTRSHLHVMPASGGPAVDLMRGMEADAPSKPFGGPEEFTFTPDGRQLVFTARVAGREEAWSTNFDLYRVPLDASTPPQLVTDNPAWDTHPVFSPDGRTLAYLAMERPGYESDRFRIVLLDWPGGEPRVLTPDWDRSPGTILWSRQGDTLYAVAQHLGQNALFAVEATSGRVSPLVEQGYVSSPSLAGDRIVFGLDHLASPVELYSVAPDGSDLKALTALNRELLESRLLGEAEQFTFAGWNDETVYAYVVKPALFDPHKKYPVAFLIHGGPQGSFGNHFHYRWNPQVYAGAGYAAVMVDFHGSTGYGQAFTDSIRGDWGGKPLVDLQKGLQAALEKYPWLDGDRVAALGASYGGYMINWIAGQWPGRFRCLVNHDGVFDMRSMYYSTEELWFPEWEHHGSYFQNPQQHEKHNPALHVGRWQTPMLVIHGANDFRVPLEQGIAAFTALQRRGIPSQFLYFPDENHWVLRLHNSLLWHETVLNWLNRWTR